jgi:hypothetical protein
MSSRITQLIANTQLLIEIDLYGCYIKIGLRFRFEDDRQISSEGLQVDPLSFRNLDTPSFPTARR